jgi:putative transposon-encoded protein
MSVIKDEDKLLSTIKRIDQKIDKINDQKINAFFESLGLTEREDVPKDYLSWETILIVVPDRHISHELKYYKFSISRLFFVTNPYADQIHIFNFNEWKNTTRNKTQLQIREILKTNFGGVKKPHTDSH